MKKLTRLIAILLLLPMLASCDFVNQFLEDTTTESGDGAENQPSVQALPFTLIPHYLNESDPLAMHAFITAVQSYQSLPLQEIPEVEDYRTFMEEFRGDNHGISYLGDTFTVRNEDSHTLATLPIYCIEWSNQYHENCDCSVLSIKKPVGCPYVVYKYRIDGEIYYRYVVYDVIENGRWAHTSDAPYSQTCYEVYHEIKSSTEVLKTIQIGDTMEELHQVTGVRLYDIYPLTFQSSTGEESPPKETVGTVIGRIDVLLTDGMLRVDYKSEMTYGEFQEWRLSLLNGLLLEGTSQKLDHLTISKMNFYPYGSTAYILRGSFDVDYGRGNSYYDTEYLVALPNGPVLP